MVGAGRSCWASPSAAPAGSQVRRLAYLAGLGGSVALASISYAAPIIGGAATYGLTAIGLALLLREPAFRRPTARASWRAIGATARESAVLVRRSPFLLTLFATSALVGAASEGFDRLSGAHVLALIPAALAPVTAFALIDVAKTILGIGMGEIARRGAGVAIPMLGPLLAIAELIHIGAALVTGTAFLVPNVLLYLRAGGHARTAAATAQGAP